jgi:hypothetical protein
MRVTDERPASTSVTSFLRTVVAACAVFALVAAVATLAIEVVPHARGVGFFSQLRFAVTTPVCLIVAFAASLLYRRLEGRFSRPRRTLGAIVFAVAAIEWFLMVIFGPPGLAGAAALAVMATAVTVILVVPRFVSRTAHSLAIGAGVLVAVLEVVGVFAALASEPVAPPGPAGVALHIPPGMFDANHRFVELSDGAQVHYVDEGVGETRKSRLVVSVA